MSHPQHQGAEQHTHNTYQQVVSNAGQPAFDLNSFWQEEMMHVTNADADFKNHALPLARIKKVMKTDQDVKMISAEAPILFAKGSEIFIAELTKRAWVHAEENKRRTLQRSDIAHAISKSDMYDFLIDIVPREEIAAATGGSKSTVYEGQNTYPGNPTYYPPAYPVDASAYYPPLPQFTNDQVQQYQMQMQQFAQQNPLSHPQGPPHPTYQAEPPQPTYQAEPPQPTYQAESSQPTYQDKPSQPSYPDPKHSPSYQSRSQEPSLAYDPNAEDEIKQENK